MSGEDIKITQEPQVLIQSILGKVLDGKNDRVTINLIMIGNTGTIHGGKEEPFSMQIIPKVESKSWFRSLFSPKNKMDEPVPDPVRLSEARLISLPDKTQVQDGEIMKFNRKGNFRKKYEVSKTDIEEALRKTQGNQVKSAKLLNIPDGVLRRRIKEYGLRNICKPNGINWRE